MLLGLLTLIPSCYRPLVLSNAAIYPTMTLATRNDFNFSYALFNQFASNLEYSFRLDYSTLSTTYLSNAIGFFIDGVSYSYGTWPIVNTSYAESGILDEITSQRLSRILFDRNFNVSNKADNAARIRLRKSPVSGDGDVNLTISIKSKINYAVNVGTILLASQLTSVVGLDNFAMRVDFFNNNVLLQDAILYTSTTMANDTRKWDLGTILTNVNNFNLVISMTDIPPTTTSTIEMTIFEFNLFALSEIIIESGDTDDLWGWEYEAVEWYNILGHLKNLGWWLVNESPISPIFSWLDDYILSWIRAFFNILEVIIL
jgi:hypothetical protein